MPKRCATSMSGSTAFGASGLRISTRWRPSLPAAGVSVAEDVWDACTNPERIPRWFLPVSGELRLGGRYQLEGNAGGTIEGCDPPKSFFATWEYGGEVSWIEVRLTAEAADRTRLELEHIAHVSDERWAEFGPAAVGIGWDSAVLGLSLHLSGR